jgi:Cu/Ag efflux protein CusF
MRAWKAAALVNCVLVIAGVLGGRQVWRRTAGPADALAGPTITWGGPEQEWRDIDGVVRAVLPELGIIVLTHADIPGFMPGMTMGFRMAVPKIPEALSVGDAVRFTVRGSPLLVVVTAIEKTPRGGSP